MTYTTTTPYVTMKESSSASKKSKNEDSNVKNNEPATTVNIKGRPLRLTAPTPNRPVLKITIPLIPLRFYSTI
jgi:hypothetical protein